MIGFAGHFKVVNAHGGSITIHYTTENLMIGESFVVIVDGKIISKDEGIRTKESTKENNMTETHNTFVEIPLQYGTHVVELAAQSIVPHQDHKSLKPVVQS